MAAPRLRATIARIGVPRKRSFGSGAVGPRNTTSSWVVLATMLERGRDLAPGFKSGRPGIRTTFAGKGWCARAVATQRQCTAKPARAKSGAFMRGQSQCEGRTYAARVVGERPWMQGRRSAVLLLHSRRLKAHVPQDGR
jgi:hypothetical protein